MLDTKESAGVVPEGWSAEDAEWLRQLPEGMQGVAAEHGRRIFCLVIQVGQVGEQVQELMRIGSVQTKQRVAMVLAVMNQMATDYLMLLGEDSGARFRKCKADVEKALKEEAPRIQLLH